MSASKPHWSTWSATLTFAGLLLGVTAVFFMRTASEAPKAGPLSIPGAQRLTEVEMRAVTGG